MKHPRRCGFPSCLRATVPPCLLPAFTLIEIMVVVTLISVTVGTVAINLDGFTERGRLRSAARQIAAIDRLARTEAVSSGEPRRLVFERDSSRCLVQAPQFDRTGWNWSAGQTYRFATRVGLQRLIVGGQPIGAADRNSVRIRGDGTSQRYACLLTHGTASVGMVIDGVTGMSRYSFAIDATNTDALLLLDLEPRP